MLIFHALETLRFEAVHGARNFEAPVPRPNLPPLPSLQPNSRMAAELTGSPECLLLYATTNEDDWLEVEHITEALPKLHLDRPRDARKIRWNHRANQVRLFEQPRAVVSATGNTLRAPAVQIDLCKEDISRAHELEKKNSICY